MAIVASCSCVFQAALLKLYVAEFVKYTRNEHQFTILELVP
jgi:hypothetical protein